MKYEPNAGTHIDEAIKRAWSIANNKMITVELDFNGIILKVDLNSDLEKIKKEFQKKLERKSEEYKNSEEYKKSEKIREEYKEKLKAERFHYLEVFQIMDMKVPTILRWLKQYYEIRDNLGHEDKYDDIVLERLLQNGHRANQYTNDNYTKDKLGEYIIGQFMAGLENRTAVPQIILKFIEDYFKSKN